MIEYEYEYELRVYDRNGNWCYTFPRYKNEEWAIKEALDFSNKEENSGYRITVFLIKTEYKQPISYRK